MGRANLTGGRAADSRPCTRREAFRKTKRLCLCKETKAQTSAVPLFLPGRRRSGRSSLPGNGGGPEGPTAVSALCSKGIFPASSRPPCTKRRLSVRLGGGYLAFSAHSCDILSYLIRFPAACQEFLLPIFHAWGILALAERTGGPPITNLVRYSTAGASPRPTKDGHSKKWEETFQSGRVRTPAPTRDRRRSRFAAGVDDLGGLRAHNVRPYK